SHPDLVVHSEGLRPEIELTADRAQLEQVFTNLFKNAVEAMNGAGEIFLHSSLVKKGDKTYCRVQIHDVGPGMSEEARARAFHPYFTTKSFGTGLGLAIVERLVFDHQGSVWFESQPGFGTTFFVELPVEDA
ncbi:MAG: ATP-binding protein, partial [Spirochaetales bacterium]|nr:ATP-binding protein [Spirochaetales bacterium]